MKLLRRLMVTLFILVLCAVVGAFLLINFVDPNRFKPMLQAEALKRTGYQLMIEDDLSWSFYPHLGVKAKHLKLLTPKPASELLVDAQNISIALSIRGLLQGDHRLTGNIYIAHLNLSKLNIDNARIGLHFQNGVLNLQPIVANLYSGKLQGKAQGQDFATVPKWNFAMQLNSIQVKPLLFDLNGANSKLKLSGMADFTLQADTRGQGQQEILKNLNGAGNLNLKNGLLEGVDFNYFIQSADHFFNTRSLASLTATENTGNTTFDNVSGTFGIANGRVTNNDLVLNSSAFTTQGTGNINLVDSTLDYQLKIIPLHTTKTDWSIPVLVKGDLHDPTIRLDGGAFTKMIGKEQIERVRDTVKEQIIDKLPEKANQFIGKLLGN